MLLDSILSPEGAAVIFGLSSFLFGLLLVLDSKRKPGETQDYRFMQRVYGWILLLIPCLFVLGGLYMKFSAKNEMVSEGQTNPFRGGKAPYLDRGSPSGLNYYQQFQWTYMTPFEKLLYYIGLYRFKNESDPLYQAFASSSGPHRSY
jgi:hypothetical protein